MMEILKGYPDNVLAISGTGEITSDDYANVLIPELDARISRHGVLRLLYVLGPEYSGFDAGAAWADMKTGISNWNKFDRIAVVTDVAWIKNAMLLFAPFYHHAIRVFPHNELGEAQSWITSDDRAG